MRLRSRPGQLTHGLVGMALLGAVLAGCGSSGSSASTSSGYCTDLSAAKDSIAGLLNDKIGSDTFADLLGSLHRLRDEAPPALHADWVTFTGAVDAFDVAMRQAGLTMDDMRDMGSGTMPGGMDMQTAMEAASALGAADVSTAESAIADHGSRSCGVDLNS